MSHTVLRVSALVLKMSVDPQVNKQTPQSRIPLPKLFVPLLVKIFSAFHEAGPFINRHVTALHFSTSRTTICSPYKLCSIILILYSDLCQSLPSGLFPPSILPQILYAFLLFPTVPHVLPIRSCLILPTLLSGEQYKSCSS